LYDFLEDSGTSYFTLFHRVYGTTKPLEKRWKWEYFQNPNRSRIKIFVAEEGSELVAATTRMPFELSIENESFPIFFSQDSMVLASYRRKGIMRELYRKASETRSILYSKGATPPMLNLLMKFGYKPVLPNTYLVHYSFPGIVWHKIKGKKGVELAEFNSRHYPDFTTVEKFGPEFDNFWNEVAPKFPGSIKKNSTYMNWRYISIPHKKYIASYRRKYGKIISVLVLGTIGAVGKIVDILWDPMELDEPARSIAFSKHYFKKSGYCKILCWSTFEYLRKSLKSHLFFDRGETPHFSVYSNSLGTDVLTDGRRYHFVDGDGDYDYL
jgi:hypothetical protein